METQGRHFAQINNLSKRKKKLQSLSRNIRYVNNLLSHWGIAPGFRKQCGFSLFKKNTRNFSNSEFYKKMETLGKHFAHINIPSISSRFRAVNCHSTSSMSTISSGACLLGGFRQNDLSNFNLHHVSGSFTLD